MEDQHDAPEIHSAPSASAQHPHVAEIEAKYAESVARNNVIANLIAGVYDREGEGHLETDLAALALADS